MGFVQEFKEFAVKGNAIDMAVGIVIGAAFGGIVNSLVKDVIMPPIGYAMKGIDFSNLKVVLVPAAGKTPEVAISYGLLINAIINFLIVALAIFIVIQQMNKLKKKPQELPPSTKECEFCKETISVRATRCPHCTATLSAGKPLDQQPA